MDGSGSHQIYNQLQETPEFNCKSFILFAFKPLSIHDCNNAVLWDNQTPNSQFEIRPVALLAAKENEENVRHLMETYINPFMSELQENGIPLPAGIIRVKIIRSMFDCKMAGILSGAGGAHCQLCTANIKELHDVELIGEGFPINRSISAARELFETVNKVEFLALPSNDRFGITHEPISDIDIICSSPLHAYTCIFRWFMTLVYHLHPGTRKWSPSSPVIKNSMKFCSGLLMEKTGMKIDQPSSGGGTTSTGNIARLCFIDKNQFLFWVNSLIPFEFHEPLTIIHTNLSVVLRIYNSDREINTERLDILCKETYEYIVINFSWANITPSLHKLLAHCSELIRTCNNSHGLKDFSEEAVEVCNKLIRKCREHLSRKFSFSQNTRDIFIRLLCNSDPVLNTFRKITKSKCKKCVESEPSTNPLSDQDSLFSCLTCINP